MTGGCAVPVANLTDVRHTRDEPPLRGAAFGLHIALLTVLGALLGVGSAFAVPVGPRIGVVAGAIDADTGAPAQALAAAAQGGSYGTLLSLGVAVAFLGVLLLGVAVRVSTGSRLAPLGPVTGWLVVALLALSNVRGDLVLPAMVTPGIAFLFAGVIGGSLTLLPTVLLPRFLRPRSTFRDA